MRNITRSFMFLLILILLVPKLVRAQEESIGTAEISNPDITNFPNITVFLNVKDEQGEFVRGLTETNIRILENGASIPPSLVQQLQVGVQFVIALNPGRPFALQNSRAISRYDYLLENLSNWANRRKGSTIDDLSLIVADGPQISHISDIDNLQKSLETIDRIAARDMDPDPNLLSQAIDLASDNTPRLGMGRAILFITPILTEEYNIPIDNIVTRANQHNIQVHVWMVSSEDTATSQAADNFKLLAENTGGEFLIFSGENTIADPENYLDPLRYIYHLEYVSKINQSAENQLNVEVQTPSGKLTTPPKSFNILILPPDPAFISPPIEITRKIPPNQSKSSSDDLLIEDLIPTLQEFQVLVSFPDEIVRPLTRTSLYVDGVLVDQNTSPPFDVLYWDLRGYTDSASHVVIVETEDELGLIGRSIETVVGLTIELPETNPWSWIYENIPVLSAAAVFLAGAILFLVLILGGRIQPRLIAGRIRRRRQKSDPVTQPVKFDDESTTRRMPDWVNRLHWPHRETETNTLAFLNPITESDHPVNSTPIPITHEETIIGSNSKKATIVIDEPSIEPLHARLIRLSEGSFQLKDAGSVAGTWINYTPVSAEGALLEHGDLVHIGRIGFRFTLRKPTKTRKLVITELDQEEDA